MLSWTSLVGAATAAGSAALVVAPQVFTGPAGLADTADSRALVRAMAARDVGIGIAMLAAPPGRARRLATAARVVADWTDVGTLTPALPRGRATGSVVAFAVTWGALSLGALLRDEHLGR